MIRDLETGVIRVTRKTCRRLRVPVLPEEEEKIKALAKKGNMTVSEFLRRLALGCKIKTVPDREAVRQLAEINADQSRLVNLFKMWMTKDDRFFRMTLAERKEEIGRVLADIRRLQEKMREKVENL